MYQELFKNSNVKLYRGISAANQELLSKYINSFVNGEIFYGGRASIYGTGIYTVLGNNKNIASDYASDGGTSTCGIIIEAILSDNTKIIESSKIDSIRSILFDKLKKLYSSEIEGYLNVLQDDGAFASIIAYDVIKVEEKNYMVVLNRQKMIINSNFLLNNQLNGEEYPKR